MGISEALQHNPLVAAALLFVAGIVTSLNPCIYPMIPITAGTLAGVNVAGRTRRRTVGLTLTYVSGLALLYAALLTHLGLALWSLWRRRSLRMQRWEAAQLAFGLAVPALLAVHVFGTRVAAQRFAVPQ